MDFKKIISWLETFIFPYFISYFIPLVVMGMGLMGIALAFYLISIEVFNIEEIISQNSITALILMLLVASILSSTSQTSIFLDRYPVSKGSQTLDTRLHDLTQALTQAGSAISAIEQEINSRQELVEKLEKQKGIAEEAIRLSKEQVDAVSALLSEQVAKQSRRDSRIDWIKQIIFFILGVLATIFLTKLGLG